MKKFFLMVVAAMMATVSVNAQDETKHEIGVFYGIDSASDIVSSITSAFAAAAGDQSSFWGPVGVEYYYHVSPVVGVGGVAAFAGCKAIDKKTNTKDLNEKFITVMPSVKFNWLQYLSRARQRQPILTPRTKLSPHSCSRPQPLVLSSVEKFVDLLRQDWARRACFAPVCAIDFDAQRKII